MAVRTGICNVTVVTMDEQRHEYENGWVLFEGDRILAAGDAAGRPADPGIRWIDGQGGILMPGMINVHSHLSMIPFRSLGDDCPDRLRRFLFPLERKAMTPELVYRAARYAVCELLLAGVTSVVDMYYFEEQVARACDELGIRAWVGETVIDQPTCDSPAPGGGLALCEALLENWRGNDRVRPVVAPHAANTCTPRQLRAAWELARRYDALYTLHVSEMDYEMSYFAQQYGQTPIAFLHELGVLGPRTLAVHCIHATEEDIALLAQTGTRVAHCAGSNTKAGKGVSPVRQMAAAGVPVGLGTDGPSSGNTLDLFTQFRMVPCLQKTRYRDRSAFPARQIVAMGTLGGAACLGEERRLGSIEPGKKADLVLVETRSANMFPCYDPCAVLVYSANAANVDSVWVDGRQLVRGGRLTGADLGGERARLAAAMTDFQQSAAEYAASL